uniref:Uncharacterized protein n=1 Tax=Magallana gigas TaxID=29159 RepID=K1QH33_MAGGI
MCCCSDHCLPSMLWDGHVPVSVRTTVPKGDVAYKHVLESTIPVMDHNGPDRPKITPEPVLNVNGKLTVREGETIGPFVCIADCNPPCNITWRVQGSDGFSDACSEMGTLLQQAWVSCTCKGSELIRSK